MQRDQKEPSAAKRLSSVEGLRGYLALWVVVCHVLWWSGVGDEAWSRTQAWSRAGALSGLDILANGAFAVDVFIIISGFVIFLLLDTQKLTYSQFVVRRYFRLFPLFIILFVVAIPLSHLMPWSVEHATPYLTPRFAQWLRDEYASWWTNAGWHMATHVFMLHGIVPQSLLPNAPDAFLVPAWSISLEWQFYLVAPLAFTMAISRRLLPKLILIGGCGVLFVGARTVLPAVNYGAALPFHVEYFCLGAVSYLLYKHRSRWVRRPNVCCLAGSSVAAVLILTLSGRHSWAIPTAFWLVFLGVILEPAGSLAARTLSPVFTNPATQLVGRISYSIYLSHVLVIGVLQDTLLVWEPRLSRAEHFSILLLSTLAATIAISVILYRLIEQPGIRAGRFAAGVIGRRGRLLASGSLHPVG
jgi:peptidoglycan/LPS O-acetylase OafA/YrhL